MTNPAFLERFLNVAVQVTGADRGLIVDAGGSPVCFCARDGDYSIDITTELFVMDAIRQAIEKADVIITNNAFVDASSAPTTNTSFTNLRIVLAAPLSNQGVFYLDRTVRNGVIDKATVDRLMALAEYALTSDLTTLDESGLLKLYDEMNGKS